MPLIPCAHFCSLDCRGIPTSTLAPSVMIRNSDVAHLAIANTDDTYHPKTLSSITKCQAGAFNFPRPTISCFAVPYGHSSLSDSERPCLARFHNSEALGGSITKCDCLVCAITHKASFFYRKPLHHPEQQHLHCWRRQTYSLRTPLLPRGNPLGHSKITMTERSAKLAPAAFASTNTARLM
jgi:hypothetical protein